MKICILSVSDTRTSETDESGKFLADFLSAKGAIILKKELVKDEKDQIQGKLIEYADTLKADIILTTGGTGFSLRDVTPEATHSVIEKDVPGISEYLRAQGIKQTKRAMFSRGISGIRKQTLIINLPGSLMAVKNSLISLIDILPHSVDMIQGKGH